MTEVIQMPPEYIVGRVPIQDDNGDLAEATLIAAPTPSQLGGLALTLMFLAAGIGIWGVLTTPAKSRTRYQNRHFPDREQR